MLACHCHCGFTCCQRYRTRVCALPGKEETATCFALRRSMLEACGQAWRIAYYDVLSFHHMTYDLNVLTTWHLVNMYWRTPVSKNVTWYFWFVLCMQKNPVSGQAIGIKIWDIQSLTHDLVMDGVVYASTAEATRRQASRTPSPLLSGAFSIVIIPSSVFCRYP